MNVLLCRQIRTNGLRCKVPAMKDAPYCYFHTRLNTTHTRFRHTQVTRGYLVPGQHIQLTALEDRESVQLALSVVINALATGHLETKRATALLYGLQLASMNAARLNLDPYPTHVVRTAESTDDGLDLTEPGATMNLAEYAVIEDYGQDDEDEDDNDDDDCDDDCGEDEYRGGDAYATTEAVAQPEARRVKYPFDLRNERAGGPVPILPSCFAPSPRLAQPSPSNSAPPLNPPMPLTEALSLISLELRGKQGIPCDPAPEQELTHD